MLTGDFWPFQSVLHTSLRHAVLSSLQEHLRRLVPGRLRGVSGREAGCCGEQPPAPRSRTGAAAAGELLSGHTAELGLSSWRHSRGYGLPLAGCCSRGVGPGVGSGSCAAHKCGWFPCKVERKAEPVSFSLYFEGKYAYLRELTVLRTALWH